MAELTVDEKKKKYKEVIDKYDLTKTDYANLTDQELQELSDSLTGYTETYKENPDVRSYVDANKLKEFIKTNINERFGKISVGKLSESHVDKAAEILANAFANGGDTQKAYNDASEWLYVGGGRSLSEKNRDRLHEQVLSPVFNRVQGEVENYRVSENIPMQDYSQVQTSVGDILKGRQELAADQSYLQDYLANAPAELAKTREEFFKGQRKSSIDYLNQYVIPEQITPYEQSGLATDREISKMISNLYSGVNTSLQEEEVNQAIQDVNFFSDAAYKTKLQELVNSRGNLKAQIDSDFQTARQQQQQGFLRTQQATQNKFDLDMFQRENERALQQYQQKLQQQQSSQKKANEAAMFGGIGSVLGGVAGAVVAGPVGAAVGGSAGGLAGNVKGAA